MRKTKALKWLNKAVAYAPESAVEALASRARFYRQETSPTFPAIDRRTDAG